MNKDYNAVPLSAFRFAGEVELAGEAGNKSSPLRMMARTGDAIEHPYWGTCVHDMAGLKLHKTRLPVDYNHNADEIVGYVNKFETGSGDLIASGALVPYKESDRATEIIHKAAAGVPYEASIYFDGSDCLVELIDENQKVSINNREFVGPLTVFRSWNLRGIAVCPYGADRNATSEFNNSSSTVKVKIMKNDVAEGAVVPAVAPVEAAVEVVPAEQIVDVAAEGALVAEPETVQTQNQVVTEVPVEAVVPVNDVPVGATELKAEGAIVAPVEAIPVVPAVSGLKFLEAFGAAGGVWFAEGKSFEQAQQLFTTKLVDENKALTAEVVKLKSALENLRGAVPVKFQADDVKPSVSADDIKKFGSSTTAVIGKVIKFS